MISLLVAATVTVTAVYAATLARDLARQHWANALDASREAVLVVVGWAAVLIVLSAEKDQKTERKRSDESATIGPGQDESAASTESVLAAQERVRRLRARLAELAATRERAGSGADPDLDHELATTSARLERARQWLTSAHSARAAHRPDTHHHPEQHPAEEPRASVP